MEIYEYSFDEIEEMADRENLRYNKERLEKIKPLDAYDYAEKMLGVNFDWKFLTPVGKLDGVTFFNDCTYWVWPCRFYGEVPTKEILLEKYTPIELPIRANTIIIDQSILDKGYYFKEKTTVCHECGHIVCHPNGFDMATCEKWEPYEFGSYKKMTLPQKHERQANHFAAALQMPRNVTIKYFQKLMKESTLMELDEKDRIFTIIDIMAERYEVSQKSMMIRLIELKLIQVLST